MLHPKPFINSRLLDLWPHVYHLWEHMSDNDCYSFESNEQIWIFGSTVTPVTFFSFIRARWCLVKPVLKKRWDQIQVKSVCCPQEFQWRLYLLEIKHTCGRGVFKRQWSITDGYFYVFWLRLNERVAEYIWAC